MFVNVQKVTKYYRQVVAFPNVPIVNMEIVLHRKNVIVILVIENQIMKRVFQSVIHHVIMENVFPKISVNVMAPLSSLTTHIVFQTILY